MSQLEQLIIESMDCTAHEAKIKANSLASDFVCKNPEQIIRIQEDMLRTQNERINQLQDDKFTLASNHIAFMSNYPKPNADFGFLPIKDMELPIKGNAFDDFVINNGLNLVKP